MNMLGAAPPGPAHVAWPAARSIATPRSYIGFVGAVGGPPRHRPGADAGETVDDDHDPRRGVFLALALDPHRRVAVEGACVAAWLSAPSLPVWFSSLPCSGCSWCRPSSPGRGALENAPEYVDRALNSSLVKRLDQDYGIVDRLQSEINSRLTDAGFVSQIFGGVLAGRALANGVFQSFTVLILTLYFLASLPTVRGAVYAMVPACGARGHLPRRRDHAPDGVVRHQAGRRRDDQCACVCDDAPGRDSKYAAVLAVMVGFPRWLIPMVGATIGAVLVCGVAFFREPRAALIAATYYLIYQQLENYVVAPRIMARTVAVQGTVTVVAALAGGTLLGVLAARCSPSRSGRGLLLLYEEVTFAPPAARDADGRSPRGRRQGGGSRVPTNPPPREGAPSDPRHKPKTPQRTKKVARGGCDLDHSERGHCPVVERTKRNPRRHQIAGASRRSTPLIQPASRDGPRAPSTMASPTTTEGSNRRTPPDVADELPRPDRAARRGRAAARVERRVTWTRAAPGGAALAARAAARPRKSALSSATAKAEARLVDIVGVVDVVPVVAVGLLHAQAGQRLQAHTAGARRPVPAPRFRATRAASPVGR